MDRQWECVKSSSHLRLRSIERVPRHRNRQHPGLGMHLGVDPPQRCRSGDRLWRACGSVLEGEEALPGRVRVADATAVDQSDAPHAPAQQGSGDGAAEGARAQQQALLAGDALHLRGQGRAGWG